VVDDDINSRFKSFVTRFPNIGDIIEIQTVEAVDFIKVKNLKSKYKDVSVCFICHKDDADCINKFRLFRQLFYRLHKTFDKPQIVAILPQNNSLKKLFPGIEENARDLNVTIKELYTDFFKKTVIVDNKEDYDKVAICVDFVYIREQKKIKKYIEEYNQADWSKKTDFEKDWNRYPARHLGIKLRAAGINLSDLSTDDKNSLHLTDETRNLLLQMEHNRWCAEKLLTGYILGEKETDEEKLLMLKRKLKYHPGLIEWKNLSHEEQIKDSYTIDNLIYAVKCQLISR
jgi:hypothetical protein